MSKMREIYYNFRAPHWWTLLILSLAIVWASIHPLEPSSYVMHQSGTFVMLLALFLLQSRIGFSFSSYFYYMSFLFIHVIGTHYLYSYVPYNLWIQEIFHFDLDAIMGWKRNMYDRLVHLAYGALLYPCIYRMFKVWIPQLKPVGLFFLSLQFVMSSSLVYEFIEWWIALGMSPEAAENYNGQQGDIWDAHQDMFIATVGTILVGLLQWGTALWRKIKYA